MKSILVLLILLLWLSLSRLVLPVFAQEQTETPGTPFNYGAPVNGTLSNGTPSTVYTFGGLRGDVIAIDLSVTTGNLDPMITLMDSQGKVLALSDDAAIAGRGSRDLHLDSLHIPRSDQYSLVVARFGYSLGTTTGGYTLEVNRIGVSSASGSALRYGDSVYNTITDSTPQVYYSFQAARGDVISVRMQRASGDLDPAIQIVNNQSQIINENDDAPGTLDAAINGYIVRDSGVYVIIASRFGEAAGRSKGSFVLTLVSGADSGLGKSVDLAFPLLPGVAVQGVITAKNDTQFYSFTGKKDDVVTIHMNRVGGALDSFLKLLDPTQREVITDDDSGGGQNSLIDSFVLPMDGTYTIIATRFDPTVETSVGPYEIQVNVSGNAFQNVPNLPRLDIGASVQGAITNDTPQVTYVFVGRQGDAITITMNKVDGNLDPRLIILNADQKPISSDDDSGGGQNARIDPFTVPITGIYYVVATRFNGSEGDTHTTGTFTLSLAQKTS